MPQAEKQSEGWGFVAGSRHGHYFRAGYSLCGRWEGWPAWSTLPATPPGEGGRPRLGRSPACVKCWRAREREADTPGGGA